MKDITIRLSDAGTSFATRERAKSLASSIEAGLKPGSRVVVDFTAVLAISYSFADQLTGDLLSHLMSGKIDLVTFRTSNEEIRQVLDQVVERRINLAPEPPRPTRGDDTISLTASAA